MRRARARLRGAPAVSILFALLVAASIGAFFVTTRLKRTTPVVQRLQFGRFVSPNGDGRHDTVRISFRTKRRDDVTVAIVTPDGDEVRVLLRDRRLRRGRHVFRWDGRDADGAPAPDGDYRVRVLLRHQGRSVTSSQKLFVDTVPPAPVVRYVKPDAISPGGFGGDNHATVRFDGPTRVPPRLLVYRTDLPQPRLVARRIGRARRDLIGWDGRVGLGTKLRPAPAGNYLLLVRVVDAAGNVGPVGLPERGQLRGSPGLIVRYVAGTGPRASVPAGRTASFRVQSGGRRYRWRVHRLGSRHTLERGSSRAAALRVRAPRGRSGVFLLALRAGSHRYQIPFPIQARRRQRLLVVLPATTWQALNPLDADQDGFSDTLAEQSRVALQRPFAGDGLPRGFSGEVAPTLAFLDRAGLRYDVTTDLAFAAPSARPPVRYDGLLFAGPPAFYPRSAGRLVRSYVEAGGRVGWLGAGGFTRAVDVKGGSLVGAGGGPARNLFGETLVDARPAGLLTVLGDRIDFFAGVGASFGPFPALEEEARLPRDARLLASAGRDAGHPSLVVYRDGKGVVARVGVDGFSSTARSSPDAGRIMRRLWTLLSR